MQGRFKRDGSAEGDPELRGSADRGSPPQRAQDGGQAMAAQDAGAAPGASAPGKGGGGAAPGDQKAKSKGKKGKGKTPLGPDNTGSRLALRNWHISTRLVSLLALPVIAATTLGGLRIGNSLQNVDQLDNMKRLTEMTEQATELAAALQEERDRSAGPLVSTGNEKDELVVTPREKTDRAIQAFKEGTGDIDGSDKVMAGVQSTVLDITRQLTSIKNVRERAYDNKNYVSQTVNSYNQLIESLLSLSQDMAQATSNSEMIQSTRALAAFSSAKEFASIQRAIISAGLAHPGRPELSESDRLYARTAADSEHAELGSFSQIYGDGSASDLIKPLDSGDINIREADKYRDRMLHSPDAIKKEKRTYVDWMDQDVDKITAMGKIEQTLLTQMEQQARELRSDAQREAYISGALILLVLGISLVGAFVVARSMVRSLRRLQDTAQEVARNRLPELVKQMSEADPQDVDTSVESVGVHSRDEIGKVAAAFDDVHREAVRLAGEQALLRGNVNAMFTNLSRRSQGLIQRQLSLISELESREADPDQLSSLFKLDHLATRMRRNGENLLVLAGEEPGRRWTRPVPLVDVLRAAASEVEQYERIELNSVPATEVAGRVVNDLVHLLAELLENATSFSSPQTKVKVTGHALPDGRVLIEIHDTGIGLSPEDLSAINERLANPPTVDVSVSRRMGLFVVGRLSLRHGIRIQLRPSDSGGTTALVMLPVDVAQGGAQGAKGGRPGAPAGMPSGPGGPGGGPRPPKGAGLAAALQRGPQSGGPGVGAGAAGTGAGAGRLGAVPPRGQVGGAAQRPALPGSQGGQGGEPAPASNLFGAPIPPRPGAPTPGQAPGGPTPGTPPLPTRGGPAGELPGGQSQQGPGQPGQQGQAPGSGGPGDTSEIPQIQAQQGGPGSTGQFPQVQQPQSQQRGPGDTGEFALPQRGGPGQGGQDGQGGPGDTGQFPQVQPPQPQQGGPGDTGSFPLAQPQQLPQQGGPSDTGQFARPQAGGPGDTGSFPLAQPQQPQQPQSQQPGTPGDTGEYARPQAGGPSETGEYALPQPGGQGGPGDTGQFPQAQPPQGGPGDTGQFARPGFSDVGVPGSAAGRPSWAAPESGPAPEDAPRGHDEPDTGEHARPGYTGAASGAPGQPGPTGQETGETPVPSPAEAGGEGSTELGIPNGPPAPADAPTPIFASMESNWFRGADPSAQASAQGTPPQPPHPAQTPEPEQAQAADTSPQQPEAPTPRPGQPASAVPPMPQRQPARNATGNGGSTSTDTDTGANWGASPNDERWRRAEQVRQPAAGGVTTSGLPRRVPRANLVAGTAQQQSDAQSGPQVSRAPDDVRGRLTNLRRGIQQGRQAGTDGRGIGPTYQQER
ncbi:nitrate- and nitrite sensing domain-containing protein [Streptomyces sp. NPDC048172]|uniref:sensor histidine kinase n=1 Tax=Streptomyces sp. NPDC048172 TaxID=3365505 RepID=UPI003711E5D3